MTRQALRSRLVLAILVAVLPLLAAAPKESAAKLETVKGKVVPLAELIEKTGSKLDADAAPYWLALVTADGKVYPLIKDGGSRLFFKDSSLLRREMQLTGRLLPGSNLLRVASVRSVKKGVLHEVYYWCDICSIRRGEKEETCECCGGKMDLREDPVK